MGEMRARHDEDIKLERERTENRLRENIRSQLRTELSQEMQQEFEAELAKTQELHKTELEEIRRQYDEVLKKETAKFEEMLRSPKSSNLPKQVEEVEVQVSGVNLSQTSNLLQLKSPKSQICRDQSTSPKSNQTNMLASSAKTCSNCSEMRRNQQLEEGQQNYIYELKLNFEQELERQQVAFGQ